MMDQNQQIKKTSENKVQNNAWGLHNPEFPEQASSKTKSLKKYSTPKSLFCFNSLPLSCQETQYPRMHFFTQNTIPGFSLHLITIRLKVNHKKLI